MSSRINTILPTINKIETTNVNIYTILTLNDIESLGRLMRITKYQTKALIIKNVKDNVRNVTTLYCFISRLIRGVRQHMCCPNNSDSIMPTVLNSTYTRFIVQNRDISRSKKYPETTRNVVQKFYRRYTVQRSDYMSAQDNSHSIMMLSVKVLQEDKKFICTNTKLIVSIEMPLMTKPMYSKGE